MVKKKKSGWFPKIFIRALLITLVIFLAHWLSDILFIEKFAIATGIFGMALLFVWYLWFTFWTLKLIEALGW